MREANARVARRALDDGAARLDLARLLGPEDEAERGAVLDRPARVHELGLAEDLAPGLVAERVDADLRAGGRRSESARGGEVGEEEEGRTSGVLPIAPTKPSTGSECG